MGQAVVKTDADRAGFRVRLRVPCCPDEVECSRVNGDWYSRAEIVLTSQMFAFGPASPLILPRDGAARSMMRVRFAARRKGSTAAGNKPEFSMITDVGKVF